MSDINIIRSALAAAKLIWPRLNEENLAALELMEDELADAMDSVVGAERNH